MSDKTKGGKILNPKDADFLSNSGKESQERRKEAMEKRQKEEDAKKLVQKTGKESQERRGKGNVF
jgi:hypothetical protein